MCCYLYDYCHYAFRYGYGEVVDGTWCFQVLQLLDLLQHGGAAGGGNGAAGVVGRLGCCTLALLAAAVEWVLI
jgi:hypothetical protein